MKTRKNLISESGAIMLEVVAVLSLMGLMGTMLFRQMYVRNQELHNIQMASEIRVVKDAFAAWIQAQSSRLGTICEVGNELTDVHICPLTDGDINDIKTFLPEGYFSDETVGASLDRGEVLANNFILKLVGYRRGTAASNILTYYGVVIPDPSILPDQGETDNGSWNFRRAARVAMLIGIDGGAYDPAITGDEIAGAVGTWHLPIVNLIDTANINIPTYVAITGTDVFQPEIDVPDVRIGLPEHWNLALHDATAYGKFTAGAPAGCYETVKNGGQRAAVYNNASGIFEIRPDNIYEPSDTCLPAFYVESGDDGTAATGNVHVLNDLTVGRDWTGANAGKAAIRFDKDGMIVFEKAEVDDPQNPGKKVNYMLDPQYTSVMNDIKIMSRGGAKLSEILPNYILKGQEKRVCSLRTNLKKCTDATTPAPGTREQSLDVSVTCPSQYKAAVVVIPVMVGVNFLQPKTTTTSDTSVGITSNEVSGHTHTVSFAQRRFAIELTQENVKGETTDSSTQTKTFSIQMGYKNGSGVSVEPSYNEDVWVIIQTYCVFDANNVDWNADGTVNGSDVAPTKERTMDAPTCGRIKAQSVCVNMGCRWDAATNVCGVAGP